MDLNRCRNSLKGKKILILGGTAPCVHVTRFAKEMGAYVYVAGEKTEKGPAKQIADEAVVISTNDFDSLLSFIKEKKIDMGHARAILATPSAERQLALYQRILREGLSVRKVEALAQGEKSESRKPKANNDNPYATLENELRISTGLKIKIQNGKVVIPFADEAELTRIAEKLV